MAGRHQPLNERQQELQNLLQRRKDLEDAIRHFETLMKLREETPKAAEITNIGNGSNSDVGSCSGGMHNISTNPEFVSTTDYYLQVGSLARGMCVC